MDPWCLLYGMEINGEGEGEGAGTWEREGRDAVIGRHVPVRTDGMEQGAVDIGYAGPGGSVCGAWWRRLRDVSWFGEENGAGPPSSGTEKIATAVLTSCGTSSGCLGYKY